MESYRYNAFISYSQAEDEELAPAIQTALQRIGMPWHRLSKPKINIFRDATSLGKNPGKLTESIKEGIRNSDKFILLCSPRAKESYWVNQEVEYFKELCKARNIDIIEKIIIVVTQGDIKWDYEKKGWDLQTTNVLPKGLIDSFSDVPLWRNLKNIKSGANLDTKSPRFKSHIVDIAAFLLEKEPSEIDSIELRTRRMLNQFYLGAVILLLILSGFLVNRTTEALKQKNIAEENAAEALKQKNIAEKEKNRAEDNSTEALKQKKIAEVNEDRAKKEKNRAEDNAAEALKQKKIAEDNAKKVLSAMQSTDSLNKVLYAENEALNSNTLNDLIEKTKRATTAFALYDKYHNPKNPIHIAKRPTIYTALYDAYLKRFPGNTDSLEIEKVGFDGEVIKVNDPVNDRYIYSIQYIPELKLAIKSLANGTIIFSSLKKTEIPTIPNLSSVTATAFIRCDSTKNNSLIITGHNDGKLITWKHPGIDKKGSISIFNKLPNKVIWISPVNDFITLASTYNKLFLVSDNKLDTLLAFNETKLPTAFSFSQKDNLLFIGFQNGDILIYHLKALPNTYKADFLFTLSPSKDDVKEANNKLLYYDGESESRPVNTSKIYPPISIIRYDTKQKIIAFSTTSSKLYLFKLDPELNIINQYQLAGIKYLQPIKDILIDEKGIISLALKNRIIKWPLSVEALNTALKYTSTVEKFSAK